MDACFDKLTLHKPCRNWCPGIQHNSQTHRNSYCCHLSMTSIVSLGALSISLFSLASPVLVAVCQVLRCAAMHTTLVLDRRLLPTMLLHLWSNIIHACIFIKGCILKKIDREHGGAAAWGAVKRRDKMTAIALQEYIQIPVEMQFGVLGQRFSSPPAVMPMLEGLGAAPMLNSAPRTVKLTPLRIISLQDRLASIR
jgi:hypothetical protein